MSKRKDKIKLSMIVKFGVFIQSIHQFKKVMQVLLTINQLIIIHHKTSIQL
jgi:hypothetical protein